MPQVEADGDVPAGLAGGLGDAQAVLGRRRERLVHQDVPHARAQGGDDMAGMAEVGAGDDDGVQRLPRQHLIGVRVAGRSRRDVRGGGLQANGVGIRQGRNARVRAPGEQRAEAADAPASRADDADVQDSISSKCHTFLLDDV